MAAITHDIRELEALLHLILLPGNPARHLDFNSGPPTALLELRLEQLGADARRQVASEKQHGRVQRALEVIARDGIRVIVTSEADYPRALRDLSDAPVAVFMRGRTELLARACVAVVGARRATEYGLDTARMLGESLSAAGVCVASGMALGIDAAAHHGALRWPEHGSTIGVLGCGVDVVYPQQHARLYSDVIEHGLLISEFVPGEPAFPYNFPRRNRLIAALARAVVVVEAALKSGALITAGHALEMGRDVLAVPGPIGRPTSEGANQLIRDGAAIVTCAEDVLTAAGVHGGARAAASAPALSARPDVGADALRVWELLDLDGQHVEVLAARVGVSSAEVLATLLELELLDHARQLPGMRFARVR